VRFHDNARKRIGKQNFENRRGLLNDIDFEWTQELSDGAIKIMLKKLFSIVTPGGEVVFPWVGQTNSLQPTVFHL